MSTVEAWRAGGRFAEGVMPPELDEEFREALQVPTVAMRQRVELVGEPGVRSGEDTPGEAEVTVAFSPAGPPFWKDHLQTSCKRMAFVTRVAGPTVKARHRGCVVRRRSLRVPANCSRKPLSTRMTSFEEHELAAARRAIVNGSARGRRPDG